MRDILKVAQAILAELDCPRSLTVKLLIDNSEWTQLTNLSVSVADYQTSADYGRAAQATELLRKADFLPTQIDLHGQAVKTFFEAEQQCYHTNERLYRYVFQPPRLNGPAPEAILALARRNIASWLGKFDDLKVAELARHGPGATYHDRGATTVADKMSSDPHLTHDAWNWLVPWSSTAWARALSEDAHVTRSLVFVPGNRFTSVPKDSKKNRGIAIEPSINVYFQLGAGRLLRDRLRRGTGIDLRYAQDDHKADALSSSRAGDRSTIDLSNASDTVCKNLVKILLPHDWHEALDTLRSKTTLVDGRRILLEKFSSMGNGFTFELETVLFLGLAVATGQYLGSDPLPGFDVRVFGDDIIVPNEFASEFITVLNFCGFSQNPKKTFLSGPFRESCGGDYWNGVDVRPLYITSEPSDPFGWMVLANRIFKRSGFKTASWKRCVDHLPLVWRNTTGPARLGDVCLHTDDGWDRYTRNCITYQRVFLPVNTFTEWRHFRPNVVMACALYGAGHGSHGISSRGSVSGYRRGRIADS